jgi:exodeoxyribonuclease VII large subunit
VTRAVASSRTPTLVAIGHEVDTALAELAADRRASTPSNAAELLVPDKAHELAGLHSISETLGQLAGRQINAAKAALKLQATEFEQSLEKLLNQASSALKNQSLVLEAYNPVAVLRRGYAVVRQDGKSLRSARVLKSGGIVDIQLNEGGFAATVDKIKEK